MLLRHPLNWCGVLRLALEDDDAWDVEAACGPPEPRGLEPSTCFMAWHQTSPTVQELFVLERDVVFSASASSKRLGDGRNLD